MAVWKIQRNECSPAFDEVALLDADGRKGVLFAAEGALGHVVAVVNHWGDDPHEEQLTLGYDCDALISLECSPEVRRAMGPKAGTSYTLRDLHHALVTYDGDKLADYAAATGDDLDALCQLRPEWVGFLRLHGLGLAAPYTPAFDEWYAARTAEWTAARPAEERGRCLGEDVRAFDLWLFGWVDAELSHATVNEYLPRRTMQPHHATPATPATHHPRHTSPAAQRSVRPVGRAGRFGTRRRPPVPVPDELRADHGVLRVARGRPGRRRGHVLRSRFE